MTDFIQNFHFLRPYWLLLLILPLLFYWNFFRGSKNKSSWENIVDKKLLNFLLIKGSSKSRKMISVLAFTGFIFAITALAGPTWKSKEAPILQPDNPVMILLNLSSDMFEKDVTPNRLVRAKHKIADLIDEIKKAQGGLIIYTDEPFLITPVTDDLRVIKNLLPAVDMDIMPSNGDRLDRAISMAVDKLKGAGFVFGNIVVFTPDATQEFNNVLLEARRAKKLGFNINIIGVAESKNEKLELTAQKGGGTYVTITADDTDILSVVKKINDSIGEDFKLTENLSVQWEDFGYYLLIIPLMCCLIFFRKGILGTAIIFAFSNTANAGFFLNNNQEGLKYFSENKFEKAAEKFENNKWKAASYYRMGDYEKALQEFDKSKDTTSLYNQGNALAKSGKIEEAIKKYEKVLEINHRHEDAKFNLEYLRQMQEQQQNESSQNNNNDENEQNNQQQNQQIEASDNQNDNNEQQEQKEQQQSAENNEQQQEQNQQQEKEQNAPREENNNEEKQPAPPQSLEDSDRNDFNEEMQAREMLFREVPENPGGLLRAFIKKEYKKNRYKD